MILLSYPVIHLAQLTLPDKDGGGRGRSRPKHGTADVVGFAGQERVPFASNHRLCRWNCKQTNNQLIDKDKKWPQKFWPLFVDLQVNLGP